MTPPRILFLDDDHVLRIFRLVLANREHDAVLHDWFAPERIDVAPLVAACAGLRVGDGAVVGLPGEVEHADLIVTRRGVVTAGLLAAHPALRLVQRLGPRPEGLDLAALRQRQVQVSCLPRPTLFYTAEHALMLMLALAKQLLPADAAVRRGAAGAGPARLEDGAAYNWAGIRGAAGLHGATLGIVGLGEVGTLVARLALAFGMQVIYTKPRRNDAALDAALGVRWVPLDELLASAQFVSLHAANTPANRGLCNRAFFAGMAAGAFFINTSRGLLVDEDALHAALLSGHLGGAGLDVHAIEPRPAGDRFAALPNVVLTPHLAGGARSGVLNEFAVMAANMRAALQGTAVRHAVSLS